MQSDQTLRGWEGKLKRREREVERKNKKKQKVVERKRRYRLSNSDRKKETTEDRSYEVQESGGKERDCPKAPVRRTKRHTAVPVNRRLGVPTVPCPLGPEVYEAGWRECTSATASKTQKQIRIAKKKKKKKDKRKKRKKYIYR